MHFCLGWRTPVHQPFNYFMTANFFRDNIYRFIIGLLLMVLVVLIFSQKMEFTALDLGRHLANGQHVWQHPEIFFKNFYSYTEAAWPFVNHHWLAGVIFYILYSAVGFNGLSVINILFWFLTLGLAFFLALRRASFYSVIVVFIPAILLLSERINFRPENFSYLFLLLVWWVVEQVSEKKNFRLLFWLLPLFALWANTHIYFFLGLAVLAFKALSVGLLSFSKTLIQARALAIAENRDSVSIFLSAGTRAWQSSRLWWRGLFWAVLACLVTPNTWRGLLYPFNILREYGYQVAENKSVFFMENLILSFNYGLFKNLLLVLIFSWIVYFFMTKKLRIWELLLSLFFSGLALFATRNLALFALVFIVIAARNFEPLFVRIKDLLLEMTTVKAETWFKAGKIFLIISLIFLNGFLFFDSNHNQYFIKHDRGWGLAEGSEESVKFFKEHNLVGPIFNNYDLGSALIFWLYPQEQVFVDNRPEAYSVPFFQDIYLPLQTDAQAWSKYSAEYGFKTIYFSHTDSTPWARQFLSFIFTRPEWELVYFDRYVVILTVKSDLAEADEGANDNSLPVLTGEVFRSRLRALAAESSFSGRFHLAGLAELAGHSDLSREIYRDILLQQPENRQALVSLAYLYASQADQQSWLLALDYFNRALARGYILPDIYNQKALVYWQLGNYQQAAAEWRLALRRDKKNATARHYLSELERLQSLGSIPAF